MKRIIGYFLIFIFMTALTYSMGKHAYTLAAQSDATPPPATPSPYVAMIIVKTVPLPITPALTPTARPVTPTPTATPVPAPEGSYDHGEFRCLARYVHSSIPSNATMVTNIVSCEVVQNRTVNPGFRDSVRYELLSGDFGGYNPESKYYKHDRLIADYAMRSWELAKQGDYSYRYTPRTGIYLSYSEDGRYCKVYDINWRVVCDTSQFD